MPCFSSSCCAPLPLRFCSAPPQLPWPCWFTPSAFRPNGRLSRCAACLDGARRCSVEGFAPVSSLSAISPPGISHSLFPVRWRCQSRLLLAVAGGARFRGGWRPSAITQLQGFSSCSRAAVSHQWSSTRMTTSLAVERSEPGCGLPPALSFKDVHHPRWGGRRAELGSCLPHGLVTHFFLQHLEEKDVHQPCEGGELRLRGVARPASATSRRASSPLAWMILSSLP
jgi:hypothetical protein